MAGTFPGVANAQQQDIDGLPMAGCQLSVYVGATQAFAPLFSDIGLTLALPNPLTGDAGGRLPLFFVADGIYRIRLTDSTGVTTNGGFDYSQIPSIGPSSGGGGGGGGTVDPTTIAQTGDIKPRLSSDTVTGWVRVNGRTIGSATSGASERANADTQNLFTYIWTNFSDAICPVPGGRGGSPAADFAANKQITLFDLKGRSLVGFDDMGGANASRLAAALFGTGNGITVGSSGGEAAHTITVPEMPDHGHTATVTDPGHTHSYSVFSPSQSVSPGGGASAGSNVGGTTGSSVTGISVANAHAGGGGAHNNMQPFAVCNWLWKL